MNELSWTRFALYYPGVPWRNIIVMSIGQPSEQECIKIVELGLYSKIIDPNDIKQFPEFGEDNEHKEVS